MKLSNVHKIYLLILIIGLLPMALVDQAIAAEGITRNVPGKYSTIQAAINAANDGDTILIADGTYNEKLIDINKAVTIASNYLVDGKDSHISSTIVNGGKSISGEYIFETVEGTGRVTFIGLTVKGSRKSINANSEIKVDHCHFIDASDQVSFEAEGYGSVTYCTFETPSDDGVDVDARPDIKAFIEIDNNTFLNNGDDGIEARLYKRSSSAPLMPYYIRNNRFINAEEDGIQLIDEVASRNDNSRIFYISNNLIINSGDAGIGCMPEQNTDENFGGAPGMKERVYITNNTIVGGNYGITGGDNTVVLNCIIKDHSGIGIKKVNDQGIVDYTVFHNNGAHLSNTIQGTKNFKGVDPEYDPNTYQLLADSVCIDRGIAGYTHKGVVVLNLAGSAYSGNAPDLGAFEFSSSQPSVNQAPVVDAGGDMVVYSNKALLNGSVTDDGLPGNTLTKRWYKDYGPGSVSFSSVYKEDTTATFALMGIYGLKLTGSDGALDANDKVTVKYVKDGDGDTYTLKDTLFIEAEEYSYLYGTTKVISDGAASGSKAVQSIDGQGAHAFADYNVITTEQNVDLYIWVRLKAKDTGSNSAVVEFNGSTRTIKSQGFTADNTYHWKKFDTVFPTEAGNWRLRVRAKEDGVIWDQIAVSSRADFVPNSSPSSETKTVKVKIAASADDAEEVGSGAVVLNSSDLELVADGSRGTQTVGLRFRGVGIPRNATILNAHVQFKVDEVNTESTSLTIRGQASDNTSTFSTSSGNISSRPLTKASVSWQPSSWTSVGATGSAQKTPSLTSIVQEIVNRSGWSSGNSLAIIVRGSGERTAEAFDGDKAGAPTLYVEYTSSSEQPTVQTPPTVSIKSPAGDSTFDEGDAITFNGAANDAEDGTMTSSLAWRSNVNGSIGKGGSFTTASLLPGVHTITATVTDSDGLKASDQIKLTVKSAPTIEVIKKRIAASADDAEEAESGSVVLNSTDIELVADRSRGNQTVGLRFRGITIPRNATIRHAHLQFKVDEVNTEGTALTIRGQATDNAPAFSTSRGGISARPVTKAAISWKPASWTTIGKMGADQRTPGIASIIQEIVNRSGWSSGNSLVIIVRGSGERTAEAFDGDKAGAPLLHIEFTSSGVEQPTTNSNQAPIANAKQITLKEDSSVNITLTGSDPDGDKLTYFVKSQPKNGTLVGIPPNVSYTPKSNYYGQDSFSFVVNDGTVDSTAATVSLSITSVNDVPVAKDDGSNTGVYTPVEIDVTANDRDADGDSLKVSSDSVSELGAKVYVSGGNVIYDGSNCEALKSMEDGEVEYDTFRYTINDSNGGSDTASVAVTVIGSSEAMGDCFADLVTDTEVWKAPSISRPGYLKTIMDPIFGTKVTRVTDPGRTVPNIGQTWESVARHHYSKDQAWNADQTLLMLDRGTSGILFLDGETYEPLFIGNSPGRRRWHPTEPDLQIYVRTNKIGIWNVTTDEKNVLIELKGYSDFTIGEGEGNLSDDGRMIAVAGLNPDGKRITFAYDLEARKKYPDIPTSNGYDFVTISPLGNYIVVHGDDLGSVDGNDQTQVYNLNGSKVGTLWSEYHRPGHYDLTMDENGDQVAVGVSKASPDKGRVISRRLRDGKVTVLTPGGWASHTSARNLRRPGWVYVTFKRPNSPWLPYYDEIVAVKLDGSMEVQRLVHTHAAPNGYLTEAHGSPSLDGTKVIFASNWDNPDGSIAAYVVDLCLEDSQSLNDTL